MSENKQYTREELRAKLSDKESIFCHEYIVDWNKARAARAAGYSEDTARQIGYELFTKPYIKEYIDIIKNDIEKEAGISKLRQVKELSKIAYSSIAHLHNTWITLKDFEELTDIQKEAIESIDTKTITTKFGDGDDGSREVEYVKIKLYSKVAALEMINKMMGYNEAEKINHSGSVKVDDLSKVPTEELIKRANAIKAISGE